MRNVNWLDVRAYDRLKTCYVLVKNLKRGGLGVKNPANFMIKMIAIDLDGTLLDLEGNLKDRVISEVDRIVKKGIAIIIATGRDPISATQYAKKLRINYPIVACNGAVVWDPEYMKILFKKTIPLETAHTCLDKIAAFELTPFILEITKDCIFIVREATSNNQMQEIVKIYASGLLEQIEFAKNEISAYFNGTIYMVTSYHKNLEICPSGINKATGVAFVANLLSISREEIACIGDGENDVEMFEFANKRVAVDNAVEPVKRLADFIAPPNYRMGVVDALKWLAS